MFNGFILTRLNIFMAISLSSSYGTASKTFLLNHYTSVSLHLTPFLNVDLLSKLTF